MSERHNIEWKQSWHDDYLKWICGFANAVGGTIYIGKDDEGKVVDVADYRALLENIPQKTSFRAGYIDAWGRGTLKIINACKEAGLPEPEIIEKDGGVQVTLYKASNGGQVVGQVGGQVKGLTKRQREVYELIVENPKVSRKELADLLGINESAVQKHTDALKKKKLIEREGETTGKWKVTDKE